MRKAWGSSTATARRCRRHRNTPPNSLKKQRDTNKAAREQTERWWRVVDLEAFENRREARQCLRDFCKQHGFVGARLAGSLA